MLSYFKTIAISLVILCLLMACAKEQEKSDKYTFDLQGHRGCRGLMPENSLAAFQKALELGVNTLELDLAVSADSQLVVSHEPWFSASICTDSLGNLIDEESDKQLNIFKHTYEQVKKYDCGSNGNARFPNQQKIAQVKPLLIEVIELAKKYAKEQNIPLPYFNIEIKSNPEGDGLYHPSPAVFSDLVYHFLKDNLPLEKFNIQSFDVRVLQYFHNTYPEVMLAYLVGNQDGIEKNMAKIDFTPTIYSPAYQLLDAEKVRTLQSKGMKVIPWTVNETQNIAMVLSWGVDGVISDYPDRALVFKEDMVK